MSCRSSSLALLPRDDRSQQHHGSAATGVCCFQDGLYSFSCIPTPYSLKSPVSPTTSGHNLISYTSRKSGHDLLRHGVLLVNGLEDTKMKDPSPESLPPVSRPPRTSCSQRLALIQLINKSGEAGVGSKCVVRKCVRMKKG